MLYFEHHNVKKKPIKKILSSILIEIIQILEYTSTLAESPERGGGLITLKLNFLKIIVEHPHYLPLNLPLPHKIGNIETFPTVFW